MKIKRMLPGIILLGILIVFLGSCGQGSPSGVLNGTEGKKYADTLLFIGLKEGNAALCMEALEAGADPESLPEGCTVVCGEVYESEPLIIAMKKNRAAAEYLIASGADVNCVGILGETPLMLAIKNRWDTTIDALLEAGAATDVRSGSGKSIFSYIIHSQYSDSEKTALLDKIAATGVLPEADDFTACYSGNGFSEPACFAHLLAIVGYDCRSVGVDRVFAEFLMGEYGSLEAMTAAENRLLLQRLLFLNSYMGNGESTALLLETGVDPLTQSRAGYTALMTAAEFGNREVAEALLTAEPSLLNLGKSTISPLYLATQTNRTEMATWLLEEGALIDLTEGDPNAIGAENAAMNPVILAAANGNASLFTLYCTKLGWELPALTWNRSVNVAARNGCVGILNIIAESGHSLSQSVDSGYLAGTALVLACRSGKAETVAYLLEKDPSLTITDACLLAAEEYAFDSEDTSLLTSLITLVGGAGVVSEDGGTFLLKNAVAKGNTALVEYCIALGIPLGYTGADGREENVAADALRANCPLRLFRILAAGLSETECAYRDGEGNTLLILAVQSGKPNLVCEVLTVLNPDCEEVNASGKTALAIAKANGYTGIIRLLQDMDGKKDSPISEDPADTAK